MLSHTAARYRWMPVLVLAIVLVAAFSSSRAVAQEGGGLAADCEGNSLQIDSDCDFGEGQEFTVAIHISSAPAAGFSAFQAKLLWDDDALEYRPADNPAEEVVWPDCAIPARTDYSAGGPDRPLEPSVLFGCVPFPLPTEPLTFEGPVLIFTFACVGEGTSTLTLVSGEDNLQGSYFTDGGLVTVLASVSDASVTCGGAERDRPPVEIELNPPVVLDELTTPPNEEDTTPGDSEATPVPTQTPGGPTAMPDTTPTRTILGEDGDDDDGGIPAWAWVLIGLGVVVGVGGVGFAAWRKMNEEGSSASDDGADEAGASDTDESA